MNKRGAELSINVIILAALGVLVLLILIAVFSRNIGQTTKKLEGSGSGQEKVKAIITSMNDDYVALKNAIKATQTTPIDYSSASDVDAGFWSKLSSLKDVKENSILTQVDLCYQDVAKKSLFCKAGTVKYDFSTTPKMSEFISSNCSFLESGQVELKSSGGGGTTKQGFSTYLCLY